MIDIEPEGDWYVTVYLDGQPRLVRAGERDAGALRVELGLRADDVLAVVIRGHPVRVRDKLMLVGGEHLRHGRARHAA